MSPVRMTDVYVTQYGDLAEFFAVAPRLCIFGAFNGGERKAVAVAHKKYDRQGRGKAVEAACERGNF